MAVDAKHVLVVGPSGGGKTTYLREMHANHEGPSIFLTTKKNERKALSNDDHPLRYRKSSCNYPHDISRSREWAISHDDTVQVIVDEAQNAPSFTDGEGPLRDGLHGDRSSGVKYVLATQNPMDLRTQKHGYGPVQQCEYWVFVGKAKTWHAGFLDGNGLADLKPHVPTHNYRYIVIDPALGKEGKETIVADGETDPRYG